jgi:uncharacterized membrane protein
MRRRNILLTLLVFSLLGNVFFVGSYIVTHHWATTIQEKGKRVATVVRSLHLSDGQQRVFVRLRKRAVQEKRIYLHQLRDDRLELWRLLASPHRQENREQMDRIIHHMALARERYNREIRDIIARFVDCLDDEQRQRFYTLSSENKKVLSALFSG